MFWSHWFPKDLHKNDTKFKQAYDSLVKQGVKFPDVINYFKPKKEKKENNNPSNSLKKNEDNFDHFLSEILLNLSSQKEFLKTLFFEQNESAFDFESMKTNIFV